MQNNNIIAPVTHFSRHAKVQMQRRCIPEAAVDLILDFADWTSAGNGARRYCFSNHTWAQAVASLGSDTQGTEKFRNAYVIEANDGTVITAAWLY